ncbi:hypothetical protein OHA27_30715 [Streptomyces sp. NBC_01619]|uniref:hypothetical protein n=1 Tax=Streptomyces sp. NBC_01619 TaxID=2975901 RepID=UPI00224DA009|nr:hypothetical protein [Streptomyces sp. NBC_01619]MCX4514619.1 hypothetical protein [Streptomyces sp. NBC_01619]
MAAVFGRVVGAAVADAVALGEGSVQQDERRLHRPVPQVANVNAAAAALRNWAINLHMELDGTGVQAAHVGIDVSIGMSVVPGFPTAKPEEISPVYWELHTTCRDQAELVFSH